MPSRILVVGSSNTDLVLSCPRLPRPGESLLGGQFQQHHGGKGANQAVAAARAGASVAFVGVRGDDDFGRAAAHALKKEGMDIRHFKVRKKISSGIALIILGGRSKENLIAVARSANDTLTVRDVSAARASFKQADAIVAQLEVPLEAVIASAQLANSFGNPFILNTAPVSKLPVSMFRLVHTLIANEHEAAILTGKKDLAVAGAKLQRAGCRQVVITLGAKGALLIDKDGSRLFPAPKVTPVDTVGAGDCFTGWLAVGIAEKLPVDRAIRRALAAASLSVTRSGAQSGMPYRREITVK